MYISILVKAHHYMHYRPYAQDTGLDEVTVLSAYHCARKVVQTGGQVAALPRD